MKITSCICLLLVTSCVFASEFQLEKQKLKFSFEYESFVDAFRNEILTPGLKANYLFKGKGTLGNFALYQIEYQTGAKTNLETSFQSGELASFLWSNRLNTSMTIPFGKCYAGGNFFLRHKFVSESSNQFVDIFGGLGFRDLEGSGYFGFFPFPDWEVIASGTVSDVNFKEFSESDSHSKGGNLRISRRLQRFKLNLDYHYKKIDYDRPVFTNSIAGTIFPIDEFGHFVNQQDDFQEVGILLEILHPFYFSGGYSYQINDSNNPGFSYRNHRLNFLVGTDFGDSFHLQAYGIAQRQDFNQSGRLQIPIFLDDSDYDTMGVSFVHSWNQSKELEFGVQRLTHNSAFRELDASKFVVFAALNYRF